MHLPFPHDHPAITISLPFQSRVTSHGFFRFMAARLTDSRATIQSIRL